MPSTLLAVKFFIGKPRADLADRPRLIERFSQGLDRPLTLISAPAGFGKSTLAEVWIDQQATAASPGPGFDLVAWLSCDANDNNPAQYWIYWIGALRAALDAARATGRTPDRLLPQTLLDRPFQLLQADPPAPIAPVLDALINELIESSVRILFVLDDYHIIQSAAIHEQMTYLLEHQPPNLHLVLLTRVDPALPVSRLRARGQLSEFRAADLRFNPAEVSDFLKGSLGLDLSAVEIQAIENSTEGWIAGLQMAVLAVQAMISTQKSWEEAALRKRIQEFIASFSGKHVYILDYLADEVFNRQPTEVQEFLLKTSILTRMNASLGDALFRTGKEGGDLPAGFSAKAALEYLEKSNLFLIRLDDERQWFRYHHLFADLLRARLEQAWPGLTLKLHLQASHWFDRSGAIEDAVQYALASEDWEWAAELLDKHVLNYLELGQLAVVLKWIDSLPNEVLRRRPHLCGEVAWALAHAGRYQRVPALIDDIETALLAWEAQKKAPPGPDAIMLTEPGANRMRAIVALLRAFGLILSAQPNQALALARNALATLVGLESREMAWLNWMIGYACRGMGQLDQAIHYFNIAIEISQKRGTVWEDMSTDLGIAYRFSGKLARAVQVFEQCLRQAEEQGLRNKGNLSRVEAFLSAVLLEQNHLEEALAHAQKGVFYLQWWPSHNHITTAYVYLGLVLLGIGRVDEAAEVLHKAEQEQHKGQVMPTVFRLVEHAFILFWLQQQNWVALERWLGEQEIALPVPGLAQEMFDETQETRLISLARVWIGKGKKENDAAWLKKAFDLLGQLEGPAERSRWVHASIEISLLQAIALHGRQAAGKPADELAYLSRSLSLGLAEGYRRIYLQEGRPVAEMLSAWLRSPSAQAIQPELKASMVRDLLDLFAVELPPGGAKDQGVLVEALTEREREILQLLVLGMSNREMAERLVVSEGTIKTHMHNLMGKFGAQSRTHVLARARELAII